MDINPFYIKIAKEHHLKNTEFIVGDFNNYNDYIFNKKIKGILCLQTISWLKTYKKLLKNMIKLQPEFILLTSLFYDGPVEVISIVRDYSRTMGKFTYRESYYNIYSIENFKKFLKNYNYRVEKFIPFEISVDLSKPENASMGTYTIKTENGKRLQFSGPLYMSWYTVLVKKVANN